MPIDAGNLVGTIYAWLAQYGLRILGAIAIFLIGRVVARWLSNLSKKAMERGGLDKTLSNFATSAIYYLLLVAVIVAALNLEIAADGGEPNAWSLVRA